MFARLTFFLMLLCAVVTPMRAEPSPGPKTEYQVKARLLLQFAKFTTWPQTDVPLEQPVDICVLGRDPFGNDLTRLESEQVKGHPVRILRPESVDAARECEVLFIAASEQRRLNAILRELAGEPILTISDIEGFVEAGGGIGLEIVDLKIQFDVNFAALSRAQVKLETQALTLARRVLNVGVH